MKTTLLLLSALLTSCVSLSREAPVQTRYVLDVQRSGRPAPPGEGIVIVRRFQSSPEASSRAFLYLRGGHAVEIDAYHGLLLPPPATIEEITARWLQDSGVCAQVERPGSSQDPDYVLEGDLGTFRAILDPDRPAAAQIGLTLTLLDRDERSVLWRRSFDVSEPVPEPTPSEFVTGWNAALTRILTDAEADLREAIRSASADRPDVP